MLNFCKNKSVIKTLAVASCLAVSVSGFANTLSSKQENQIPTVLSTLTSTATQNIRSANKSSPNSSVDLDFSITVGESWDAKDSSNNIVANCVNGDSITGFEYSDITIKTVGGSFFSEAVIYFSDSNNGNNGLRLTTGAGDESSGTKTFSSDGILDLTDNGLEDIVSLADGVFVIQLYENVDDATNAIDARYTNGTITVWGVNLTPSNNCPFLLAGGKVDSDLSVSYTTTQNNNQSINDTIDFTIIVNNIGSGTATNVSLNNTISDNLTFNQMSCDDGTSTTNINNIMPLNVQDIASNDSLECSIETTLTAYGNVQNSVTVNADNDNNPNNNNATVMTNGAYRVVPINNYWALFVLVFALMFFARKRTF